MAAVHDASAALQRVKEEIRRMAELCGRHDDRPTILAVSKKQTVDSILAVYHAGHRTFGENHVRELVEKATALPEDIKWHMIGHLQSNKCRALLSVKNMKVIETLDSEKLADQVQAGCVALSRDVDVFLQVKSSVEDSKSGLKTKNEVLELVRHILSCCDRLNVKGLMTVADPNPARTKECFSELAKIRDEIVEKFYVNELTDAEEVPGRRGDNDKNGRLAGRKLELSMGMSGDVETAVACGSTEVRIGTAIFGARPLLKNKQTPPDKNEKN